MTYQDSNYWVVVGIVHVIRELFYDLKEVPDESVVNVYCAGERSAGAKSGIAIPDLVLKEDQVRLTYSSHFFLPVVSAPSRTEAP